MKHPPFIVCVVLLTVATVSTGRVARWMKVVMRKDPVPLRKPLTELNREALGKYVFSHATLLAPATVSALGTDEYVDWEFRDISITRRNNPLQFARALITYHTGKPNLVPHTAEVCWSATGFEVVEAGNVTLEVAEPGGEPMLIPARAVTFEKTAVYDHDRPTVVYTFHCNGRFVATRTGVRVLLNDLTSTYAYFSKVEVSFPRATRAQCVQGAGKLFDRALPALIADHWPDFRAEEEAARRSTGAGD